MPAKVVSDAALGQMIEVIVASDPFTTWVERKQVEIVNKTKRQRDTKEEHKMPTATAKELRKQAKSLGIEGWEEMDREELEEAVAEYDEDAEDTVEDEDEVEEPAPRRRTSAKKAPAKKAASARKAPAAKKSSTTRPAAKKAAASKSTKKAAPARTSKRAAAVEDDEEEGDNPFRAGSNLFLMTEELMKGGKRSAMVRRLSRKIELNPRVRGGRDYDSDAEIDYRLVRVCQVLTNEHGFIIEKDGRGTEQTVKAIPPSAQ